MSNHSFIAALRAYGRAPESIPTDVPPVDGADDPSHARALAATFALLVGMMSDEPRIRHLARLARHYRKIAQDWAMGGLKAKAAWALHHAKMLEDWRRQLQVDRSRRERFA